MIIKTRYRIALLLLIAVILLSGTYFLLTKFFFQEEPTVTTYTPPDRMAPGEYFNPATGALSLFEYESTNNITSFRVHNEKGDYRLLYNEYFKQLRLEHYEGLYLESQITSTMLAYACIPNTNGRITDGSNTYTIRYENGQVRENVGLTQYGLAPEDDPAYYEMTIEKTVKDENGADQNVTVVHKVYLGNVTPLGNAYYCRYEGRNEIYTLSPIFQYITFGKEALLIPYVVKTNADTNAPWLDRISIAKYGELKVEALYQQSNYGNTTGRIYTLSHPVAGGGYTYDADVNLFASICTDFIQLQGDRVVAVINREQFYDSENDTYDGDAYAAHRAELLKKYGLSDVGAENPYTLVYGWNGLSQDDLEDLGRDDITQEGTAINIPIFISTKTEDNTYYAYSILLGEDGFLYEQIVEIQASAMPYLEYETIAFLDDSVYFTGIVNVDKISFKGNYTDENDQVFSANEVFRIRHSKQNTVDPSTGESTETAVYSVDCLNAGKSFSADSDECAYFGALYALTTYSPSYVSTVNQADLANKVWVADITFTLLPEETGKEGKVLTFSYYRISSTLLGVSLDGGEHIDFAVHYSGVNDIMSNVNRVVNGEKPIVSSSNGLSSIPNIIGK